MDYVWILTKINFLEYGGNETTILGVFKTKPTFEQLKAKVHELDNIIGMLHREDTYQIPYILNDRTYALNKVSVE